MGGRPNPLRIPVCSLAVVAYKTTTAGGERIFFFFFPNRILLLGVVSDWNSLKAHWKLEHLFLFFLNNNSSSCLVGDGRGRKNKFLSRGEIRILEEATCSCSSCLPPSQHSKFPPRELFIFFAFALKTDHTHTQ